MTLVATLSNLKRGVASVTLASAAPFEGCDVNSNPFPGDRDIGVRRGHHPFPTSPRTVWRLASMAVRSCFFISYAPYLPFPVHILGSIT